jgi:hypothetical protein
MGGEEMVRLRRGAMKPTVHSRATATLHNPEADKLPEGQRAD